MKTIKTPKNIKSYDLDTLLLDEDTFIEIKDIKKGDFIYECDETLGINYEYKAINDARKYDHGWTCLLTNDNGEEFEIFVSGNTQSTYLPKLYRTPQFIDDNGEVFYYPVI